MSESAPRESASDSTDSNDKELSCPECGKSYGDDRSLLNNHMRGCCPELMVECVSCDRLYSNQRGMEIHHSRAHGESLTTKSVTCKQCGEKFEVSRCRANEAKFCNDECHGKWLSENVSGEDHHQWKDNEVELECENCGKTFTRAECEIVSSESVYCSQRCHYAIQQVETECYTCGKIFTKSLERYKRSDKDFCSRECREYKIEKECEVCGTPFKVPEHNEGQKTCSYECMGLLIRSRRDVVECVNCGENFENRPSENHRYCSRKCWHTHEGESRPEKLMRLMLDRFEIRYDQEWKIPGTAFRADFHLTERDTIIEVDGRFWHSGEEAERRDGRKNMAVRMLGMDIMRIPEMDVYEMADEYNVNMGE